jgi:hypothetical protein
LLCFPGINQFLNAQCLNPTISGARAFNFWNINECNFRAALSRAGYSQEHGPAQFIAR